MNKYIGIDLGTSAVKILLVEENGKIINSVSRDYEIYYPNPGWSEQDPNDWWNAVSDGLLELLKDVDRSEIKGIGCGGQMHGLVVLDDKDDVIRPAILWNDGRTSEEVDYLNNKIGKDKLSQYTANIAFAGFTAPKILWLKNNEPDNFEKIQKIMLPKDYINYKLTGVHSCDYSDASGMLLLDVENKCWSKEMLDICMISEAKMPKLFESFDVISEIKPDIAKKFDLPSSVKVVAGAGDNAAAAVGTGAIGEGSCNISIGTSGTIFISSQNFAVDPNNALHAFAHADGNYHLMGCILSAASCNRWICKDILDYPDYEASQAKITDEMLGRNSVYFLPYLMGERSPINDTDARGCFIGLSMDTERTDMVLSVMEGVAFALRDSLEVAKSLGIDIRKSYLCGGGSKSALWQKIMANVLNISLEIPKTEEGPGYGGAMLAMVGCGAYESVSDCAESLCFVKETIAPDAEIALRYENKYNKFKQIYPSVKELFKSLREDA